MYVRLIDPFRIEPVRNEPTPIRTEVIIEKQPIIVPIRIEPNQSREPIRIEEKQKPVEPPVSNSKPARIEEKIERKPTSKKDFEIEPESKKDFEPPVANSNIEEEPKSEIEFDRDSNEGRWRYDWQVAELVIYRNEFGLWPSDVPVETGLRSYYELRYFEEGTNRKGEKYAELHAKHRAKRDLWLKQADPAIAMDIAAAESNVLPYRRRTGGSN